MENNDIQQRFAKRAEEERATTAMLKRVRAEKGKHRHFWQPVGAITPITKPLRRGKKYATKMYECTLCGATKYKNRQGVTIL